MKLKESPPTAFRVELLAYNMKTPGPRMIPDRLSHLSGISVTKIWKWIEGKSEITEREAKKIADVLDVDYRDLMVPWTWSEELCPVCERKALAQRDEKRECMHCGVYFDKIDTEMAQV